MDSASLPTKFPIPFGDDAGPGFIRPIPTASQIGVEDGAASLTDGFPPDTFIPVSAGGTPPFGQDFNGLFNQVTAWSRWQAAGAPTRYDATFQTTIGGYPVGAQVMSATTPGLFWVSTAENNLTNPDTGGAGWASFTPATGAAYVVATGTANALVVTPSPAILAYQAGLLLYVKSVLSNTGATTINVSGLGAKSIRNFDGTDLLAGEITAPAVLLLLYDGTNFLYLNAPYAPTPSPGDNSQRAATTAFVATSFSAGVVYRYYAVTSATPLTKGTFNYVDTASAAVTLTLPASPATGDAFTFLDARATWNARPFTLNRNGNTIMGTTTNLVCDVSDIQFSLWWNGSDWRLV